MIDWKRKLSSRKFWAMIVGFITALLLAFNIDEMTVKQISTIVLAFGTLIAYILGESYVDGNKLEETVIEVEEIADIQGEE